MAAQQSNQLQGDEPPMYLQRPSSARSQDITHVLARTFRQLFTRDAVGPDTVHYLNKSRGGDDEYHERYVEALRQVQEERDHRMGEAAMLERHIMQAQARAMSADERELNRVSSGFQRFPDLGLPPTRSYFRSCVDSHLLRKHNLITPEDFSTEEIPIVPPPQASPVPNYARNTVSNQCRNDSSDMKVQTPLPNIGDSFSEHLLSTSDLSSSTGSFAYKGEKPLMSTNDLWKKQVSAETREDVRREVANLQAKVDYLKNPRHAPPSAHGASRSLVKGNKRVAKEFGSKPLPQPERKDPSVIFVASPPVLTFTEYTVGNVYEMTLELKNVTTVLRPVRVIPPKSSYFSVGLGQFPGDQGLVAPGMSCHYTIRFAPDSLGDFDDMLTVQTQSTTPLVIAIEGRRPSPILTLPGELDVGECLVGGCKVTRLTVRNDGGPGRFCMMNKASWPATNFKSIVAPGCVSLSAFEIRPAVFELNKGEMTTLEILFSPTQVESYAETLTMVCDNCQVKHFNVTGVGQVAAVEIGSIEGGLSNALPGEVCDVSAQHLIKFDTLNPYTYMQKEIEVVNKTNVEMPYNWVLVKPLLAPSQQPDVDPQDHSTQERIQDVETPFVIEPSSGILAAGTTSKFTITFAPPEAKDFQSVLHMILRDIPRPPVMIPFPEEGDKEQSHGIAELVLPTSDNGGIQDMTTLQIELKGQCEEFKVMLQPYAMYIPGHILIETPVKRTFRMINGSVSAINFEWDKLSSNYIVEVEPPLGQLGPEQELDFELTVCGSRAGKISHTLLCHVQHLAEPLTLYVEAEIKGPEVVIDNPDLNFGLVRFGTTVESSVIIRNTSQISTKWSIKETAAYLSEISGEGSEFWFCPSEGELRPLENKEIRVRFSPQQCRSLRTLFDVNVADGNESALAVRAEVQKPVACLLTCEVKLSDVYLEVPFMHTIKLLNQTLLPTQYEWGELEGEDSEFCSISIEPKSGDLGPREELELALYLTARKHYELTDLKLPCWVEGMSEPLILAVRCDVKGLGVTYRTQSDNDQPSEELLLDFGSDVPLGANKKCYVYVKNNSAITAPFRLNVEHFYAKPPTPPDGRPDAYMPSQRRALLGKTPNLADPHSKTPAKAHAGTPYAAT